MLRRFTTKEHRLLAEFGRETWNIEVIPPAVELARLAARAKLTVMRFIWKSYWNRPVL